MRDYSFSVSAGSSHTIDVEGNFLHLVDVTDPITIILDDTHRFERSVPGTIKLDRGGFEKIEVESATTQSVQVTAGFGHSQSDTDTSIASLSVSEDVPNTVTPLAAVSVGASATVLLAAADANRKALRVSVKSSEADGVYIGNISAGAATPGGWLEKGGTDYIATSAAVYAYNAAGSAITVHVMSLEKV